MQPPPFRACDREGSLITVLILCGRRILLSAGNDSQSLGGGFKTKPICHPLPAASRKGIEEVELYRRPLTQQRRKIMGYFCALGFFLLCLEEMVLELFIFNLERVDSYL